VHEEAEVAAIELQAAPLHLHLQRRQGRLRLKALFALEDEVSLEAVDAALEVVALVVEATLGFVAELDLDLL